MSKRRSNSHPKASKRSNSNPSVPEIQTISPSAKEARLNSKYGVKFKRSKCCVICKSTFGFFLPGHFCRFCGRKICHKCSPTKREIEGSKHLKRICNECVSKESNADTNEFLLKLSEPVPGDEPQKGPRSMGKFVAEIVRRHSIAHLTERPYPLSRNLPGALLRQHYLSNLRLKLKNKEITPEAFAHLKSVPPPLPQMPPIAGERARLSVPLAKKPPRPRSLNRKKRNRNKRRSSKLPKEMEHALSQALQAKMTAVRASWAGFPLSLHTTSLASESFSSPLPSPLESPLSQKALGKKDSKQHKKSERPPPMSATKVIYFDDNPETDFLPMNVKHVALRKEGRGIIGEGNAKELLASKDINFSKLTSRDVLIWDFDCTLSAIHLYKTMHMTTSKSWEGSWGAKLLVWWRESHPEDVSEEMSATELLDRIQKDPGLWNEFVMGFVFDSYLPRLRSFLLEASECKHVILSRGRAEEVAMALLTTKLNKFFSCVVDCSGCYYWPKEDFELGDTKVVYDDSREKLLAAAFESKNCDEVYDKDRWIAKELETGWRRAIPGYAHGELHAAIAASIRKRVKRHLLAKEIQTTEKAYVEKLKLMLEAHMQLSENDHELVSFADISSIFSNMKELVDISMVFLLHLEQLLDHWDDEHTCLGPLFIAFADYFKLYSRYASSFDSADEVLSKLLANPNAAAIEAILEKLKLGGPNFRNILIMPVQRVPRYKLFLVELLKNTPDHLADHVFLQQALIDIGNAAKYINQHVSLTTGLIQGIKLCNRFRPTIPWLVQGDRGVVHKGTLRKRGTGINQTLKNRYFVLFSDRLFLYCRQHQADNIEKMHFTNPRPVALVGIESLVRRGGEVMPALKYQTLDDVFSLPAYIPKGLAKTEPKDLITREEILNLYSPSKDLFWVCAKGENTQFWFDAGDQGNFDEWMEAFAYVFTPKKTTYLRETAKLEKKEEVVVNWLKVNSSSVEFSELLEFTSLESLLETDVSTLSLRDREQHFTVLSEALWQADRAGKKSELTESARERISKFLQERIDKDAEAQLRQAIAKKKEGLLAAALEVCGVSGYITDLVQECRRLQRHIAESGAGIRAAIQKCDRALLEQSIAKSDKIGFHDGDTVMAHIILQRIERLDEEAAKVHTETGCIQERVQTILDAARIVGYKGASIKKLEALVADPLRYYTAQYNSAVARQDCDYAISASIRMKDVFVQRHSDELQQLENCSILRAPKEWASDTLMGRRSRPSMFLHCQSTPHAPLTTRCASSDAKEGKKVYELVRKNHRTVMKYLGQAKTKRLDEHLKNLWETCRGRPELQDELFLVIMKQCRGNSNPKTIKQAFKLLGLLFKVFAPSPELENFVEYFIRSKPSLAEEYNLTVLIRRRVYEKEIDSSWELQEFTGSEGKIKSPYSQLKIRASPRMLENKFVRSLSNDVAVVCTGQVPAIENDKFCLLEIQPSGLKRGHPDWFKGYIKPAYFVQVNRSSAAAAAVSSKTHIFDLYELYVPEFNEGNASWNDLHTACASSRPEHVARHSNAVPVAKSVKDQSNTNFLPIVLAAAAGITRVVELLRAVHADTQGLTHEGYFPLSLAAAAGHKHILFTLQALGSKINERNADGSTPVILAAKAGHKDVLDMLIALQADVNIRDKKGDSALIHAVLNGRDSCVATLAEAGADINKQDPNGLTPMLLAAMFGHKKVVLVLHALGADIQEKGPGGITPILAAASEGHADVARTLHDLGANVNAANGSLCTPMLLAALHGHTAMVEKLRSLDAVLDVTDVYGNTPLLCAVLNGHVETAKTILRLSGLQPLKGRLGMPNRNRFSMQRQRAGYIFKKNQHRTNEND